MDLSFLPVQILTGLASAASLFIMASGLTLVFGVTRIVNFAHGSFYMLGAYVGVTLIPQFLAFQPTLPMFLLAVLAASLLIGLAGALLEIVLLRRIYRVPELFQLLATFGVVLMVQDAVVKLFGPADILGPRAPSLKGAVEIFGQRFAAYELFMIGAGLCVFVLLWLIMHKSRYGLLVRAATEDREMVGALGVNQVRLFTMTLFLGAALAGLGGALQVPRMAVNSQMDVNMISEAFVVTVIGGMGSVSGAALAALLIGLVQAFGVLIMPKITLSLVFLLMAVVLIIRPNGLLGKEPVKPSRVVLPEGILELKPLSKPLQIMAGVVLLLLVALPFFNDAYLLVFTTELLCLALAAVALQFLISLGGIVSFGHAGFFALGAYGAGLSIVKLGLPFGLALLMGPLVAALIAMLFGLFIVRLSGIYAAMLTLAAAQLIYAVLFQWNEVTGGDNGVVGLWPPNSFAGKPFYGLTVFLVVLGVMILRYLAFSPFGFALRASRDSEGRAKALGLNVVRLRLMAFVIVGSLTGLAGSLYAFAKGSIDPSLSSTHFSVDFLSMVLLGGLQSLSGALSGALVLHGVKDLVMPLTDHWRFLLGLSIVLMVLILPRGLAGLRGRA